MQWNGQDRIKWITYGLLSDSLKLIHGTLARHGGVSEGPYASLNLGDGVGNDEASVAKNRSLVQETLSLPPLVWAKQVHKTTIAPLTPKTIAPVAGCDGFILTEPGVTAMVKHADCQAALFYDPICHIAAAVHSGWRGSVQNIYKVTIDKLKALGCRPENLLVTISPSLGPEDAEFTNFQEELPEPFWEYQVKPNHFDFWEISRSQLKACGIVADHIEIAGISTYASSDDFFSYRRDATTGRNATVITLL